MSEIINKTNFQTTQGILSEIEQCVNEFKSDLSRHDEVELRLRGCNHAIKIHMIEFLKHRLYDSRVRVTHATR